MKVMGECLCGKILVTIPELAPEISVCHCQMCQKFFGGPFLALAPVKPAEFQLKGKENVRKFASSRWATRGFCGQCGSSLFYHQLQADVYYFAAGIFPDLPNAVITEELFVDHKPDFYHFREKAKQVSETDFFARIKKG